LLQSRVASDISRIAETVSDQLFAIDELLDVYSRLKCRTDRLSLKPVVEQKIRADSARFDHSLKELNLDLGFAGRLALAEPGTRMRDDLNTTKAFLDTISLRP
jgi:hypothetical protein